jgi:hypothetical protein
VSERETAKSITVEIDDAQHQLLMLALACLTRERPGWFDMIATYVETGFAANSRQMWETFLAHHPKHPREDDDMIMQLRSVVESKHPLLWQMVRELAWPQ